MRTQISILIFILFAIDVFGQDPATSFSLIYPVPPNVTKDWVASEYVKMTHIPYSNFHAKPDVDNYVRASIDPLLVFPPLGGEPTGGSPNNDEGGVVGTLPGNLMVSPSGAAVYNIPIAVPPGVNGMAPSLSLVYNSQGGNGLLGVGWSLSGLSAITRTRTTLYNNGYIDGVDFDDNDQLMLNGQRLIPINAEKTEFRTEIESFSKIVVMESNSYGPVWFKVYTKDGKILEFGNTDDSRVEAQGRNEVLTWGLNRVLDRSGNYIDYTYMESNGFSWIKKISYGGNIETGQLSCYEINFYHKGRIDPIKAWISGSKIENILLLDLIEISYQTQQNKLTTYELSYNEDFYSHLERVTVLDNEGNKFNPTLFERGAPTPDFELSTTNIQNTSYGADYTMGDFNGDGKTDVARAFRNYDQGTKVFHHWSVSYSNGDGTTFNEVYMGSLEFFYDGEFAYFVSGDFNGDGLCDLVMVKAYPNSQNVHYKPTYYFSNGTGFDAMYNLFPNSIIDNHYFKVVDMNGNGIEELLLVKNMTSNITHFAAYEYNYPNVISLFTNPPTAVGHYFEHQAEDLFPIEPGDFNGNGKTDLLVNTEELESTIFQLDVENGIVTELNESRFGFPNKYHRVFTGDFNGDGIRDILTYAYTNPDYFWELHYFNGKDEWQQGSSPITKIVDPGASNSDYHYVISDYNGDSKSDILEVYNELDGIIIVGSWFNIYYSNGINFTKKSNLFEELNPYDDHKSTNHDYNGDGKSDCFLKSYWSNPRSIIFLNKNEQVNLIKKITNGFGHETELTYKPLTNNTIYTKGGGAAYPFIDIQPAFNVVTGVDSDNGIGGSKITNYLYEGAKLHKEGKGFLGFEKLTTISNPNTSNSSKTVTSFELNTDYCFAWLKNSSTYVDADAIDPITEIINDDPLVKYFGNIEDKRFFYYTPKSLTKVYHTGDGNNSYIKTILSKMYYSDNDILWGNVTSTDVFAEPTEVGFSAPEQSYDFYTKTFYYYIEPEPTNWLIGLPNNVISETWTSQDSEIDKQETEFTYYTNSPRLHTSRHIPNNSTPMTTINTYVYDDYGNITESRLAAPYFSPYSPDRVSYFEYSDVYQNRLLTQTKNVLEGVDYVTSAEYYESTGLTKSTTDLGGLTTNYFYDGFGRLSQTIYPDGVQDKSMMYWSSNHDDNPVNGLFYTWSKRSGEQEVISFNDQLARELRTIAKDFNNSKIYSNIHYNGMGQVAQTSNSHYSSADALWTNYSYNSVGAVKMVSGPTATIEYNYNGRITTTTTTNTALNIETTKEVNAIGEVIKATDNGGVINYSYYSSGQPKTIGTGGATTYLYYDDAGYREKLVEPNAGIILYDYNPFGELISQTNANLHTYEMMFDGLGRIESKTLVGSIDDITNYTYCPEGTNGFGQLQTISVASGVEISYEFDDFSRVKAKTQTMDSEKYVYNYEYNVFGKAKKTTWPSGFAIDYHYKNGYFSAVEQSSTGTMLWELNNINAQGQITQYQLGNGLLTTKSYDTYGFPTSIFTENQVQDLNYSFNINTGNLSWRSSVIYPPYGSHTLKEVFTYDESVLNNRLETWQVEGVGPQYSINYSNTGNIDYKSDVGTYVYKGIDEVPHAVSQIEEPTVSYLDNATNNEQHITYTGFDKTQTIWNEGAVNPENSVALEITYGPNQSRCKTELFQNGEKIKTKLFIDGLMEIEVDANDNTRKLHYINAGDGLFAIYVIDNKGKGSMHYIHKDYLGSIETITNEEAEVVERLNFDPWGRRRNVTNWSYDNVPTTFLFDRGYTSHEHLDEFSLINMNGRVYDPMLGRFLSPDNYVQAPYYTQCFNRYSYCLNNPLKYTDPSGEFLMMAFFGMALTADYLSNLMNGVHDPLGTAYNNASTTTNGVNNCAQIPVYQNENTTITAGLSPFNMGVSANIYHTQGNTTYSAGVGIGFVGGTFANVGVTHTSGDFSFTVGGGYSSGGIDILNGGAELPGGSRAYGGMTYYDRPNNQYFSGGLTYFGGAHSQKNWYAGYRKGDFSVSVTNDAFISGDEHRTAAVEFGLQNMSLGFNLYTTSPPVSEYKDIGRGGNKTYRNGFRTFWGNRGTYSQGDRISASLYLGYRNGNNVSRVGIDAPWVQEIQNAMHWAIGSPAFNINNGPPASVFLQAGYNFPYSLYLY